jgi:maleate isomerase
MAVASTAMTKTGNPMLPSRQEDERERGRGLMDFTMWRGVAGLVMPTRRPGGVETLIRLLPEGIGVLALHLKVRKGSRAEFTNAIPAYEAEVAELAEQGMDVIHPAGAPPFMLLGYKGQERLIRAWEKKYKTPIFTSSQNHVAAMRALGIRKFIGASYSALQNRIVVDYMTEAGFTIASMEPIDVPFDAASHISPQQVYAHVKRLHRAHPDADGIYIQGSAWRCESIVETLEQDLQIPVVHATIARAWEIQKRLNVRQPVTGFGRLYAELPEMP